MYLLGIPSPWFLLVAISGTLDREFEKHWDQTGSSALRYVEWLKTQKTVENSERDGNTRTPDLPLEKFVCRSGSKLELDMEQQTGSKQEKEYVKAVYCHPVYLIYMQSTS